MYASLCCHVLAYLLIAKLQRWQQATQGIVQHWSPVFLHSVEQGGDTGRFEKWKSRLKYWKYDTRGLTKV